MHLRPAIALVSVAALLAVGTLLLVGRGIGSPVSVRTASPAVLAQARADALASVAKRIYFQEVFGSPNSSAFAEISRLPGLIRGLETGNLALARRTLNHVVVRHAVHERVVRGTRVLADVGLKFVIAGQTRRLVAPDGTYLGRIEVSIQDVIGFVKLFHRLTGAQVLVRGRIGHAKSSLAAARRLALPPAGPVSINRRTYYVSSFTRAGYGGEPLTVWILDPTG